MNIYNLRKKEEETWSSAIGSLLGTLAGWFLSILFFMWAWNFIMPHLFTLPSLGFWQSFAAVVLLGYLKSNK